MRKLTFLLALLCASVMSMKLWAVAEDTYIGTTDATYANQFKWYSVPGETAPQEVVNIQPGTNGIALYVNVGTDLFDGVNYNGASIASADLADYYAKSGAGAWFYLSKFTAKCTTIEVTNGGSVIRAFRVQNDQGTGDVCDTGSGGTDPDPAAGIDWSKIGWLTNATGNAAYTEKYKAFAGNPGPSNIDVIQSPGWAAKPGLYMTFPNADFRNFSLPASCYSIQGAGIVFHMDAFTAKETTVHVNVGGTVRSFTIYYKDGTEGPAEIYDINFALADNGSSATASTGTAANAIDGNNGTRWESAATDDETFTLDMGQKRIFNTIKINWEGAYCKEFELTCSNDGETWSPLYTETNLTQSGWQLIELSDEVTAQYIKYHGTKRATGWGQSFWEFQVLLPGVSVLTSIDLTSPATIAQIGGAGVALTATPKDQNGQAMEAAVSYEITPAAAGHMSGNSYIPDQAVAASIRAYSGEVFSSAVNIIGVPSANLALSTNISTDNKIIAQSAFAPNGTNAFFAVDGNMGSVWQGSPTNGNVEDSRVYDCWFVVDLGAFYDITMVALHFEGACSELYHIDFSENNTDWNLGYNLVGAEGINARNDYWTDLGNNNKVRYVRFWSTKAATGWGMKLFEFEVYGTEWTSGDEEKPVMVNASLVSSTINSAVIAVSATDNDEVARYHVVDATNGIDANFTPSEGKITIIGLTHNTAYNFTITAKDASNNESENSKEVAVTTPFDGSIDLALNKPCEAGVSRTESANASKVNDGLDTNWETGDNADYADQWWYVDLGEIYNIDRITIRFENARSNHFLLQGRTSAPSAAQKADDGAWNTLYEVSSEPQGDYALNEYNMGGKVARYVRFKSLSNTYNNQWGNKIRELCVYGSGIATVDAEAPVMTSASLVSFTDSRAIIAVAATDNQGVAKFHVADAGNSFDGNFAAVEGNITVNGLTQGTHYTFVITAVDYFDNESENSKSVEVTTSTHYTQPQAACPAPTWPAEQVKALYSPTYEADYNHQDWGSGTVATKDEFGRKYVTTPYDRGYFGADGFNLNCLLMEKLHYDIWIADDATIRIVPIWGGAEQGITVSLTGQQWNSIDINLSEYTGITDWGNIYQMKIDQAYDLTFWIANAYFYRESAIVDTEAPTNASASKVAEGFYSVSISAQADDNSGAVSFKIMNGEEQVATGAAAAGVATTIVVNGLASGTNYNFNVIAYDEAGNEATPVAVAAATKALPAQAPAPDLNGKKVVNVFSDAIEGSKTIHSGGWGESTVAQWIDIVPGDKVFYGQNFNYAGWHSWGNNIDATGMTYLHVDVYSLGMTQVSVTPISEGHEGVANITLTPNAWTSADIALSEYAANNIDWANIFQFKFMNPVDGNELLIDNVYFWQAPNYTRNVTDGNYGTICLPQAGEMVGATLYEIADYANGMIYVDEVEGGVMEAGKPYIFQATSDKLNVYYTSATVEETAGVANGLYGFYNLENENAQFDIPAGAGNYILYQNQYWLVSGRAAYIANNRAYIRVSEINYVAPAPGRRRVAMNVNGEQTATGINELNAAEAPVKMIMDGQLYILRGEKLYNANGQIVK
ncbi:MAG: discoidin domain-containing protein [Paludibacteraceae bacterium]|nr:discoidin domain-containing protein [Paludibacteraceae bacterium]